MGSWKKTMRSQSLTLAGSHSTTPRQSPAPSDQGQSPRGQCSRAWIIGRDDFDLLHIDMTWGANRAGAVVTSVFTDLAS